MDLPDPRPAIGESATGWVVMGARCKECGLGTSVECPRCPDCHGIMGAWSFGPGGGVWSSTVLYVSVEGRDVPRCLAYVDLDDHGPRVLVTLSDVTHRVSADQRVELLGVDVYGDLLARVVQ